MVRLIQVLLVTWTTLMFCLIRPEHLIAGAPTKSQTARPVSPQVSPGKANGSHRPLSLAPPPSQNDITKKHALSASTSVVGSISLRFWEHGYFSGGCVRCTALNYNQCYSIDMKGFGLGSVSSIFHENMDPRPEYTTMTFYEGPHCNGQWNRNSGYWPNLWLRYPFMFDFNDKIQSFMVSNCFLQPGVGFEEIGSPSDVRNLCRRGLDYDCLQPL